MGNVLSILRRMQNVNLPMDTRGLVASIVMSFLFSVLIVFMYRFFFERRYPGSGVGRSFIIIGPAVTTLFLAIQFSLPLSLGLLGALSFVRFRTPIKQAEEVGYILLLIASSIGCATFNFTLVGILILVVLAALSFQNFYPAVFSRKYGKGLILISLKTDVFEELGEKLEPAIKTYLPGARLENISVSEGITNLFYRFSRREGIEWGAVAKNLKDTIKAEKVNFFLEGERNI